MDNSLTLGSRASLLALQQTQEVADRLKELYPHLLLNIKKLTTRGDRLQNLPLPKIGGKGLFVKEIQQALLAGEVDLAVHSFKDLPTQPAPGLEIAAFTPRLDPRDVLVSREGLTLEQLPLGTPLGTSSPRRQAQIKALRPDLVIQDLRGNLDTRLRKVAQGEVAAAVVAAAGLIRMGWQHRITQYLPPEVCVPAVGQGALAVEIRQDDERTRARLQPLDHLPTRLAITAERAFLQALGGGCHIPLAALGQVKDGQLELLGMVASVQGDRILKAQLQGPTQAAEEIGKLLAKKLLEMGAGDILQELWERSTS